MDNKSTTGSGDNKQHELEMRESSDKNKRVVMPGDDEGELLKEQNNNKNQQPEDFISSSNKKQSAYDDDDDDVPQFIVADESHHAEGRQAARRAAHAAASLGYPITVDELRNAEDDATAAAAIRDATAPGPFEKDKEPTGAAAAVGSSVAGASAEFQSNVFLTRVFAWMTVGLLLTALVSYGLGTWNGGVVVAWLIANQGWLITLLVLEIVLVAVFVVLIHKKLALSTAQAGFVFICYMGLNGVTLSPIFVLYEIHTIYLAFAMTSVLFLVLTIIGLTTKHDLSSWGPHLFSALIALIVAELVNLWIGSSTVTMICCAFAIVIFSGLTIYDVQNIMELGRQLGNRGGDESVGAYAVMGALQLSLDFLNLFLSILQLMGGGSNN